MMKTCTRLACLIAALSPACHNLTIERIDDAGTCDVTDMSRAVQDMATPAPKCAAAKGLAGDNLLCVDFDKVTQLSDPALAGWNFNANMANCWQISGGYLQVQNFSGFSGACGLTLPALDFKQADKSTYQRATLSLLYRLDMTDPDQQAQVFMDTDNPIRLLHQMTGRPGMPTLLNATLTVNKADLPSALLSIYKLFLKVNVANVVGGRQGWQIQSIAVNGSP